MLAAMYLWLKIVTVYFIDPKPPRLHLLGQKTDLPDDVDRKEGK